MANAPANGGRRTERLGFRIEPEKAEKIRKLADAEDVPYADLLRDKADELVERYDRLARNLGPAV